MVLKRVCNSPPFSSSSTTAACLEVDLRVIDSNHRRLSDHTSGRLTPRSRGQFSTRSASEVLAIAETQAQSLKKRLVLVLFSNSPQVPQPHPSIPQPFFTLLPQNSTMHLATRGPYRAGSDACSILDWPAILRSLQSPPITSCAPRRLGRHIWRGCRHSGSSIFQSDFDACFPCPIATPLV